MNSRKTIALTTLAAIRSKVGGGETLTYDEALDLTNIDRSGLLELFSLANKVREQKGDEVDLCSIANAKCGMCSEDCSFCAQSAHNASGIKPYEMLSVEELLELAWIMEEAGAVRFCIVMSGNSQNRSDFDKLISSVRAIKKETGLSLCVSVGALTGDILHELKEADVSRIHHNIETSARFFQNICSTHKHQDRIETVKEVKKSGLEICCGGIIGMGESPRDRIDFAFAVKELDVDSVPINILMPIKGTPLEHIEPITPLEILKTIAIFRLILPDKEIRVAGGREANLRDLQSLSLFAGADGFILGDYLTTRGRMPDEDIRMIIDSGLRVRKNA